MRAIVITPAAISELQIPEDPHTLPALGRLIGSEIDSAWVSRTTQILFREANGAGAYFYLPGSPRLAKAVVIDFTDGEFRDVTWSVTQVAARVRWGEAPGKNDLPKIGKSKSAPSKQAKKHQART